MRADMFKVIVERPRRGGGWSRDGRLLRDSEEAPARLGMRRGYSHRKWLNENLAPLRRFLERQAGRPWNAVFSEICATIDARSTVKQHIRLHIDDLVAVKTFMIGGEVYGSGRFRGLDPLKDLWQTLYVDPESGVLLRNDARVMERRRQHAAAARKKAEVLERRRVLDDRRQLHRIEGLWYLVEVAELPPPRVEIRMSQGQLRQVEVCGERWDVLRKALVWHDHARRSKARVGPSNYALYGQPQLYGVSKRQLPRCELRRYGLG